MYPVLTSLLAASNSTGLDVEPSQTGDLPGEQTLDDPGQRGGPLGPAGGDSRDNRRRRDVGVRAFYA